MPSSALPPPVAAVVRPDPPPPALEGHSAPSFQEQHHHPMPLHPVSPIPSAERVRRRVRSPGEEVFTRRVLEGGRTAYAIDSVITQQPKSGITILLASPLMPEDNDTTSPSSSSQDDPSPAPSSLPIMATCGDRVVIKAVPHPRREAKTRIDNPLSEIAAYQLLAPHLHPNVIHLVDCLQDHEYIYIVLPYLSGGDLFSRVEAMCDKGLPEAEAISYLRQICEGLLSMKQSCGLAHHDLSLENVMLDNNEQEKVKIIDLGMCFRVPKVEPLASQSHPVSPVILTSQPCRGKPAYVAPEVVRAEPCDPFASDIWSLGVCLYAMLTGRPLYSSPQDLAFKSMANGGVRGVVDMYESYGLVLSPVAKELVCHMLSADPMKRPTVEAILQHPFVMGVGAQEDWEASPSHHLSQEQ